MPNDFQKQIDQLRKDLQDLTNEVYRNNFSASQDFQKKSRFNTRITLPRYSSTPATCEVGEAYVNTGNGKLYICSSANTWTSQT